MILFQNSQYSWNTFLKLEYAFEFCKSRFAEEHKPFLRRNWKSKSENQINVLWNHLTTELINYVTIDIC